jgi:formamidopyrimidine-DNA glycosylase
VPELPEVEVYRQLAERAVGRRVDAVEAPDAWILKRGLSSEVVRDAVLGSTLLAARRIGKLLLLDLDTGRTLGLRFGMTGVLELDGAAGVDQLEYSSRRRDDAWIRFTVHFDRGGSLQLRDPRRLGGIELDPREESLGVDALAITPRQLREVLGTSTAPLKARLMDQGRVAGLGNLLTDELLWRAGIDPGRPAGSLSVAEQRRLHRHLRATVTDLIDRGGSHTGDLHHARVRGGRCPKDGAPLLRRTVGGRTTYSCPEHQR